MNENVHEYDGTTAVVRSEQLTADDIEFMRWQSDRWMKSRHMKSVARHYPRFVARNWFRMMRHTFRGSSWKTWMGLESEHDAFLRYKAIRRREREYFPAGSDNRTHLRNSTWSSVEFHEVLTLDLHGSPWISMVKSGTRVMSLRGP